MQRTDRSYDHAKFLIERFDHYYESINSKGAFLIGLNTFILGGICVGYTTLHNNINIGIFFWVLTLSLFGFCLFSIIKTILAIGPFLKDNLNEDDQISMVFFGGIAKHNLNEYLNKVKNQTDALIDTDMYRQVHVLSGGLKTKYDMLRMASKCLIAEFVLIIIFSIYITQNLKP